MTKVPDSPERDPELGARWREHSSELPPVALDAAILAAAHRAVDSKPTDSAPVGMATNVRETGTRARAATGPQRWWMPLAAAATIGAVALGVLQTAPQIQPDIAPSATDMRSAPPLIPPREMSTAAAEVAPPAVPAPAREKVLALQRKDSPTSATGAISAQRAEADAAPPRPAMAAAPQPFPADKKSEAVDAMTVHPPQAPAASAPARMAATGGEEARQRNDVAQAAPAASGVAVLAKSRVSTEAGAMKAIDVEATIMRIRKLHDDGKLAEAAKELIALRTTVPDADSRLPPELRAWAATVKP